MPVKYQHPDYTANLNKWQRCEHVAAGQDVIHAQGATYLPRLSDQTDDEYNAYKLRTPFYNATWRTIAGLIGMLFRKPPEIIVPDSVKPMMEDVTMSGKPMRLFALDLAEEDLKIGRLGVFVDYPNVSPKATKADAITQNHRPLLKLYKAKSVINWKHKLVNNIPVLSMVVLMEIRMDPVDEFEDKEVIQYRVLDLVPIEMDGGVVKDVYRVRVYEVREVAGKEEDVLVEGPYFPQINSQYLDEIPFRFIGIDNVDADIDEPPLVDLVDMNLSHYRSSADYEHGCHFTGLPTPVISGHTPETTEAGVAEKFYIGSMTAWVFPRPDAKATFLEFKGDGLNALKENIQLKEQRMAILGARMLEVSRGNGVESANTASIHRSGEQSMLASVADAISIAVTQILKIFCRFAGADDKDVKFALNKDFFPAPMDALTITALIAAWQNSAMSYETMFENLQRGEFFKPEQTAEAERAAIKANPPPVPMAGTTPGSPSPNAPKTAASGTGADKTITQMQKNS